MSVRERSLKKHTKGDETHLGLKSVKDMSPKGFVTGMEFHNVPKFDCIIIWYRAVDLLKWSLKMAIIFCPVMTKLPLAGCPWMASPCGCYPAVSLQYRQLEMVTTHKNSPLGPLPAHFPFTQAQQNSFLPSLARWPGTVGWPVLCNGW